MEEKEMIFYRDRKGSPINLEEWGKLLEDRKYSILKQELLPNGAYVSTVWLGLKHGFGDSEGCYFETMVFDHSPGTKRDKGDNLDERRYPTEESALIGHKEMCELWANRRIPPFSG